MRDYGIDLMEQLEGMSWRRFACLFRNLSPLGAVALRAEALRAAQEAGNGDGQAQAADFFSRILSTGR